MFDARWGRSVARVCAGATYHSSVSEICSSRLIAMPPSLCRTASAQIDTPLEIFDSWVGSWEQTQPLTGLHITDRLFESLRRMSASRCKARLISSPWALACLAALPASFRMMSPQVLLSLTNSRTSDRVHRTRLPPQRCSTNPTSKQRSLVSRLCTS
jgi:hypothetical protein